MKDYIKVIGFDADDTLFINEPYFDEAEEKFCALFEDFLSKQSISQTLFQTQINNLPFYGYGIKGYILSMIEAANKISDGKVSIKVTEKILEIGKELLQKPIVLLDGIEDTLKQLHGKYKLIVVTKGDLKDQHRKVSLSGLGPYFHHIEVLSEKDEIDYEKLLKRLDIDASDFLMIGNSLKSDVLPVLNIGGTAIHIPFHTTWAHERIDHEIVHDKFYTAITNAEILPLLL
ncbi:HAD family hydrolase [Paenimyroides tangerinum]|uniref:HAD family hydrolase n=1 Tax=Paenimyroides tangerinum TaxID=2488728 RepID=A0A3P3WD96_9FLAO|nr:HAD family hydrolase [Paenimyroides tangerinum]RRJ90533.1 HAD family hydrolase [Paenimyroides tangerinum]